MEEKENKYIIIFHSMKTVTGLFCQGIFKMEKKIARFIAIK